MSSGVGVRDDWGDPWFLAALLAPLLLLLFLAGDRIGVPVADDYDYLYHVLFTKPWSWFDGGGANLYWRPLGRQAFYALLAPWMLHAPAAVALLQAACLCLTSALLYRTFARTLGRGQVAFAVSTGPWLLESSRLLVAWPACFQDAGALLFVSLAIHEAAAGRRWSFLAAGLAALLCKEVAAVALMALLVCPALHFTDQNRRRDWMVLTASLVAVWAAAYAWAYAQASLSLPSAFSSANWARAFLLVPWWSLKAVLSLSPSSGPADGLLVLGLLVLTPWSLLREVLRNHGAQMRAWWTWGLLWSVPLTLALVPLYPSWAPYRIPFVGFGVVTAATVMLAASHRHALTVLLALRLGLLAMAPRPVGAVTVEPPSGGASIDVPQLSRLQRLVAEVRAKIQSRHPRLPSGAIVVWQGLPPRTDYAFGAHRALCVWYGDPDLRWLPITWWMEDTSSPITTIVEFQADPKNEVALIRPEAMKAVLHANSFLSSGHEGQGLGWLSRAESLQTDTSATAFRRSIAGKRSFALANLSFRAGQWSQARSHLLALLANYPGDVQGQRLLRAVEDSLATRSSPD